MGVFYHIEPFNNEMARLLEEMGAVVPDSDGPSRNPTPTEVREVCAICAGLRHFKIKYNVKPKSHWQAVIEGTKSEEGTMVNMEKFKGTEGKPLPFYFEKGSPSLILEIVKRLAQTCGPLVIIPDTGDVPIVVSSTASVKRLLRKWGYTAGDE